MAHVPEDEHPHRRVEPGRLHGLVHHADHLLGEGVLGGGPVEADHQDALEKKGKGKMQKKPLFYFP